MARAAIVVVCSLLASALHVRVVAVGAALGGALGQPCGQVCLAAHGGSPDFIPSATAPQRTSPISASSSAASRVLGALLWLASSIAVSLRDGRLLTCHPVRETRRTGHA